MGLTIQVLLAAIAADENQLVEDLSNNRVRILTQESQIGKPAANIAQQRPNVSI